MTFFFTFIYLLNVEKPVHTCAMCRCERTTCGYHFSLLCEFQSSNSVCQAWLQAPLTTEPPRCPKSNFWKHSQWFTAASFSRELTANLSGIRYQATELTAHTQLYFFSAAFLSSWSLSPCFVLQGVSFLKKEKDLFPFMYMDVLSACMFLYYVCAMPVETKKGCWLPELELRTVGTPLWVLGK